MLETEHLILRPYQDSDVDDLGLILGDSTTMRFWPRPYTLEETEAWIHRAKALFKTHGLGRMAVILKSSGKLIGDCGLMDWQFEERHLLDLGYIIHHVYWNQGLGTEAAAAMRDYGFRTLNPSALYANMACTHRASISVAEKIGFRQLKVFCNPKNCMLETYLYQLTQTEWQAMQSANKGT